MIRRPPRSTRTDTRFPYTTLFRSTAALVDAARDEAGAAGLTSHLLVFLPTVLDPYAPELRRANVPAGWAARSEEHTSELQSLMRISYAVFCMKKKKHRMHNVNTNSD